MKKILLALVLSFSIPVCYSNCGCGDCSLISSCGCGDCDAVSVVGCPGPSCCSGSMYNECDAGSCSRGRGTLFYETATEMYVPGYGSSIDRFSWDRRTGDDIGSDMNIDY